MVDAKQVLTTLLTSSVFDFRAAASVMRFRGENDQTGTAFVTRSRSGIHLVTARHLCSGEPSEFVSLDSSNLVPPAPVTDVFERRDDRTAGGDIAVFTLTRRLVPDSLPRLFGFGPAVRPGRGSPNGISLGQELYVLGYPHGLQSVATQLHESGEITLERFAVVKRGIAAGFVKQNGISYLLMDTIASPGFSGGPVYYLDDKTGDLRVGAVVIAQVLGNSDSSTAASEPPLPAGLSIAQLATSDFEF